MAYALQSDHVGTITKIVMHRTTVYMYTTYLVSIVLIPMGNYSKSIAGNNIPMSTQVA